MSLAAVVSLLLASAEPTLSVERLASQLAEQVRPQSAPGSLGVFVEADTPELANGFITVLVGFLGGATPISAAGADEAEKEAREKGLEALVRVQLSLERGQLSARGDLLGTWVNFWSGANPARPPRPARALNLSVEADAHALALASPRTPATAGPLRLAGALFASLPERPAAISSGDLDGDGQAEIAVLTEHFVLLYSAEGRLQGQFDLHSLPESPFRSREPFGAIVVMTGRVALFLSGRSHGTWMTLHQGRLVMDQPLSEAPLFQEAGQMRWGALEPGKNHFASWIKGLAEPPLNLDAPITTLHGRGLQQVAVHPDGTGSWLKEGRLFARLSGLGASTVLADLDGDNRPELVTSSTEYAPEPDELRVLALDRFPPPQSGPLEVSAIEPEWKGKTLRGRALAATSVDLDADGVEELVLGVWLQNGRGELQVFRRASR